MVPTRPVLTHEPGLRPLGKHVTTQHSTIPDATEPETRAQRSLAHMLTHMRPRWLRAGITWSMAACQVDS